MFDGSNLGWAFDWLLRFAVIGVFAVVLFFGYIIYKIIVEVI